MCEKCRAEHAAHPLTESGKEQMRADVNAVFTQFSATLPPAVAGLIHGLFHTGEVLGVPKTGENEMGSHFRLHLFALAVSYFGFWTLADEGGLREEVVQVLRECCKTATPDIINKIRKTMKDLRDAPTVTIIGLDADAVDKGYITGMPTPPVDRTKLN